MKKYLFGLGAMLVGAGLMFVLMHGEVSADVQDEYPTCKKFRITPLDAPFKVNLTYCKIKDMTCVIDYGNNGVALSCVKD
jgi:hypothetical protein